MPQRIFVQFCVPDDEFNSEIGEIVDSTVRDGRPLNFTPTSIKNVDVRYFQKPEQPVFTSELRHLRHLGTFNLNDDIDASEIVKSIAAKICQHTEDTNVAETKQIRREMN